MCSLILTLAVLGAVPTEGSGITLAGYEQSHYKVRLAEYDVPPPNYNGWTREQLQHEYNRLEESRPSLVGPIVMLSIGVVLTPPGAYFLAAGIGTLFYALGAGGSYAAGAFMITAIIYMVVGLVLLVPGVVLLIMGAVKLPGAIRGRSAINEQMDDVRSRINSNEGAPAAPPPPPPAAQNFMRMTPEFVLAEF
jgi:hypothetical protein